MKKLKRRDLSNIIRAQRDELRRFLPGVFVIGKWFTLLFSKRSFLRKSGYFRSVREGRPVRADGSPIPWMNYGVISLLESRLNKNLSVFEYGSGNSTLFFAERVGSVTVVEHNPAWFEIVSGTLPGNARVLLCDPFEPGRYVSTLADQGRKFDVIIIDGQERHRCLEIAPEWLTPDGVILLDDANPDDYGDAIRATINKGFRMLAFEGLKAGSIRPYRTVLLYRSGNVLGI